MLAENWESYFSPTVLGRGYRYFENGYVARVEPASEGWECAVDGSERYSVFVGHDFDESYCDCPYFLDHGFCKHIAAACYEIESIGFFEGSGASGQEAETRTQQDSIELANSLDDATLRSYLITILNADRDWRTDFVRRFGNLDETRLRSDLLAGVRGIVVGHSYRGFVDYRSADRCEIELLRFVEEFMAPLIERRRHDIVFDLTTELSLALQKIEIDDSGGFFTSMLDLCLRYWGIAFDGADDQLKQAMFDQMRALIESDDCSEDYSDVLWYVKETAEEFACKRFVDDPVLVEQMLHLASGIVEEEAARPDTFLATNGVTVLHRSNHRLAQWEAAKLACMQTLGASVSELDREIAACPPVLGAIQSLVDAALANGDEKRAQQLLERFVDRLGEGEYSTDAALQLLDIYHRTQQGEMELVTLYGLAVRGRQQNDEQLKSWFRRLQKRARERWPDYRDDLEDALSDDVCRLHAFLAFTEQREKLMKSLEEHGSRYEFETYRDLLAQDYPEKYLAAYEAEVRGALFGPSQQRKVYADAVYRMLYMRKIPGGEPVVACIVTELREKYPRRRALMEELDRLG